MIAKDSAVRCPFEVRTWDNGRERYGVAVVVVEQSVFGPALYEVSGIGGGAVERALCEWSTSCGTVGTHALMD